MKRNPGTISLEAGVRPDSKPVAPSLVWFRLDLRLADNPAMAAAIKRGGPVIPVFIWAPEEEQEWAPGAASRWWLHESLSALRISLQKQGADLVIRRGTSLEVLRDLLQETGADAVFWNRRYEPAVIARDTLIKEWLHNSGVQADSFNSALLNEPWQIRNKAGKPFQVFTPFWRHCLTLPAPPQPLSRSRRFQAPQHSPESLDVADLALKPRIPWDDGLSRAWVPGETGARTKLDHFLAGSFNEYSELRNRPDVQGTSGLSPHLHFGEISPGTVWHAIAKRMADRPAGRSDWRESQFLAEVGWREFAHHLLFHFPLTPSEPLRTEFKSFPWHPDPTRFRKWTRGMTGYPIVDAGMRELWTTGWMHNRVRMITASFLLKDLLIPWQEGARWFWDTLVDADLAQNTLGWQWTSGCGADAAPYFRVFNPRSQGEKFDPEGLYVRRWCPELARLPDAHIHSPAEAPTDVLRAAGVTLGVHYPHPMVNHTTAREVALEAFSRLKSASSS